LKKKKTITSVTFFDGFVVKNGNLHLFGGFVAKKVMVAMSLPSSMVVVLWRRRWHHAFFFFFLIYLFWSF
jgi:hypothetical protein